MKSPCPKKYVLEYIFVASPKRLFYHLSTEQGLSEWYADKVILKDNIFHFSWEDSEQKATIVHKKENEYICFKWVDEEADNFFEFRISSESISNEITLIITDFALENDIKYAEMTWNFAIKKLLRGIGAKLISTS
ncbi:MAG: START-like domain-containing protein [Bacteroidales bacterium]